MREPVPRKRSARLVTRHPARIRVDEEIELRTVREQDAPALFALTDQNREYLRRWLPWVDDTRSAGDTLAFIKSSQEQLRRNDGFQVSVWHRGQLAGVLGFHYWDWTNRKTEIGYWLAAPFQGKGIMTRACRTLVDYAFGKLEFNRVEIRAAAGNDRSQALPERLGFRQEGVLRGAERTAAGPTDQVVYGLLRSDWEALRSGGGQATRSL